MPKEEKKTPISVGNLLDIEAAALEVLREQTATDGPGQAQGKLKLTGLEVLAFIAVKVALPIATGIVSRMLYDRLKPIETNSDTQAVRKVLLAPPPKVVEQVDEATLIERAVADLREEGISEERSRKIAKEMVRRIRPLVEGS